MTTDKHTPFDHGVTEEEMRTLDVDLNHVWLGVTGEIWSNPTGRVERYAGSILRSPVLARTLVTTPSLIVSWLLASATVFLIGALMATITDQPIVPLLAPAIAGIAVAFAYGAGADPAYEIARTMPISARMILLLRVSMVFVTNAILGIAATLVVPSLSSLTMFWLLPMVAISLFGLAVAVVTHSPTIGGGAALVVWSAIILAAEYATKDFAAAVSEASMRDFAPMYVLMGVLSLGITFWMSGDGTTRRELAGWL